MRNGSFLLLPVAALDPEKGGDPRKWGGPPRVITKNEMEHQQLMEFQSRSFRVSIPLPDTEEINTVGISLGREDASFLSSSSVTRSH